MDIYKTDAGVLKIDENNSETIICGYPNNNDIDFTIKITNEYICMYKFDNTFNIYGYGKEVENKLKRMGIDVNNIYALLKNGNIKSIQIYRR